MLQSHTLARWLVPAVAVLLFSMTPPRHAVADGPTGIESLPPWTTSRVRGTPDPLPPYRIERAFPGLTFREPIALHRIPGTNRLVVIEVRGALRSFVDDPRSEATDMVLDLRSPNDNGGYWGSPRHVYSIAFHPDFARNRRVFLCYNMLKPKPAKNVVSAWTMSSIDPPRIDPASERVLLSWETDGHNGGAIDFGPDGYLYITSGDSTVSVDEKNLAQDTSNLLASVLRIDVDHADDGRPYGIPPENPFVGEAGTRPEVWAYGLRNPWKMRFDQATGDLWVGDNGQDLWENIYLVQKGANYGWSVYEGRHPHRPGRALGGPTLTHSHPIADHPHTEARSVTGGLVYRGDRLVGLTGAYIYGDYETGRIWSLRHRDGKAVEHRVLADTLSRIVAFGDGHDNELYVVTFDGLIHRLMPAANDQPRPDFPRRLSETGLFTSTATLTPAPGLIPYDVNAPLWSDGAGKQRFIALPPGGKMRMHKDESWEFPDGTVLVKSFFLDHAAPVGHERVRGELRETQPWRLETRLLHREQGQWRFYTYVWNSEQTDAELLGPDSLDRTFVVGDESAAGGRRLQKWHFPSRAECGMCHTRQSRFVLGVSTRQLNREFAYTQPGEGAQPHVVFANQIDTLRHLKLIANPPPPQDELPRFVNPYDAEADLDSRARAYLHSNCAHCHRRDGGGGRSDFQLLAWMKLEDTGLFNEPEVRLFDIDAPRIVAPGDPDRSLLLHRMSVRGEGQMPGQATNRIDREAALMIRQWIARMRED